MEKNIYMAVPKNIVPIKTDVDVTTWIKKIDGKSKLEHLLVDSRLSLPVTKNYCINKGIALSEYSSNESIREKTYALQKKHNSIGCIFAYSPSEGLISEIERDVNANSELVFL